MGILPAYMSVHRVLAWCPCRPEEDIISSGTWVINSCEFVARCVCGVCVCLCVGRWSHYLLHAKQRLYHWTVACLNFEPYLSKYWASKIVIHQLPWLSPVKQLSGGLDLWQTSESYWRKPRAVLVTYALSFHLFSLGDHQILLKSTGKQPNVANTCNPSTWEMETGRPGVQGYYLSLHETLCQKIKTNK